MKGMDLASALAAPVQGRGSGQGARSRSEAGNTGAESFGTVFNDVHGVGDAAPRQTDDAGTESAVDSAGQGTDYGSAAVQTPAVSSGNDGAAFAESAGLAAEQAAIGLAAQPAPLTVAPGLPVQDGQEPSLAPVTVTATPGPDLRLAVPGALLAATAQQAAVEAAAPGAAQASGPQPNTAVPVTGLVAGVPAGDRPATGGVPGINSTAPAFAMQGSVADPARSSGATPGVVSGATPGSASGRAGASQLAGSAAAGSAAIPGIALAPNTAPAATGQATAAAPSSTAPPGTGAAAAGTGGFPAAALANESSSGPDRSGTTAATAPVTAAGDALAAVGTAAAATAPAGQPTSSTVVPPQAAAPAAPHPGATLQPQLAKPLFTLAGAPQGQHIMTLQVTPEDLGPMTVRAHIDAAGVRIELFAPGDAGREALRGILPELRKELADAGFGASLDVSDHTGPGTTARDGTSQDGAGQNSGSGPGNRNGPGDPSPGHRWEGLADGEALRSARILNGPQTTLDILV